MVLTSNASDLISLYQELLRNRLHRVNLLSYVMLYEVDLPVGAPTNRPQDRKVTF